MSGKLFSRRCAQKVIFSMLRFVVPLSIFVWVHRAAVIYWRARKEQKRRRRRSKLKKRRIISTWMCTHTIAVSWRQELVSTDQTTIKLPKFWICSILSYEKQHTTSSHSHRVDSHFTGRHSAKNWRHQIEESKKK